jgi:hypothetical protein
MRHSLPGARRLDHNRPGAAYRVACPVGVHCSSAPVPAVGTGPERMYAAGPRQGGCAGLPGPVSRPTRTVARTIDTVAGPPRPASRTTDTVAERRGLVARTTGRVRWSTGPISRAIDTVAGPPGPASRTTDTVAARRGLVTTGRVSGRGGTGGRHGEGAEQHRGQQESAHGRPRQSELHTHRVHPPSNSMNGSGEPARGLMSVGPGPGRRSRGCPPLGPPITDPRSRWARAWAPTWPLAPPAVLHRRCRRWSRSHARNG